MLGDLSVSQFLTDVRLALRGWKRAPGFALIAIASIAIAIGATTAIFTLVDQVLLRALPVPNPRALVQLTHSGSRYGSNWGDGSELAYPTYAELRDRQKTFVGLFGRFGYAMHVGHGSRTDRVAGEIVTGSYFPVLGVGAAAGRILTPEDDRLVGGHPVAVISHAFWTSRFAADPKVIGSKIVLNGHPFTLIGVARRGFEGIELGRPTLVWVPIMMKAQVTPGWNALDERLFRWVRVFGRLKPGVTAEQTAASLQSAYKGSLTLDLADRGFANASSRTRDRYAQGRLELVSAAHGRSGFRRRLTRPLWILMAIAAGVLLIACANVANLLLARAAGRQREVAVRLAIGASRWQIVRQLLVESVMLALAGGLAGLAIAAAGAPLVLSFFVSPDLPSPVSTLPDLRILAFTFALATATGILFGLAPALQTTRPALAPTLKDTAGAVLGGGHARLRKALVASQVSVSLLLLIGAGLFLRTLNNLLTVDVGVEPAKLVAFGVDPALNGYESDRAKHFARTLLERLNTAPGITAAGFATTRILEGNQWNSSFTIAGYQPSPDENTAIWCNSVSPGYFKTMGIPLLMGRDFDRRDAYSPVEPAGPDDPPSFRVAIANERFVKKYFGNANPIGRRVGFGDNPNTPTPIEIIGVVADAKYTDVRDEVQRQLFFPYLESRNAGGFTVYLRTTLDSNSAFAIARDTIRELDANLPMSGLRTFERQIEQSLRSERMIATMSGAFGALATILAIVGVYGVMAYTVARRTREIGIRMALGASATRIAWLVVREILTIAAAGMAIGLPLAWWLSRYVEAQLYDVKPMDPLAVAAAMIALTLVAAVAGIIPSRRATRVNPVTALRYE
jgi:predicted permease